MIEKELVRVLVVAPQFPSINQPWVDTYLEQLLMHGVEPAIYTRNSESADYCPKVDELGLRQRIVQLLLNGEGRLIGAWCSLVRASRRDIRAVWLESIYLGGGGRRILGALIDGLNFLSPKLGRLHLVHSHDEILAYCFLLLARLRNIPAVLTFHGLPPEGVGQLSAPKRAVLYRELSLVLVNTEFAKRQVCSLGCSPSKVVILPQGLPVAEFRYLPAQAPSVGQALQVLTVGRFHRDKGQAYAMLALKRLLVAGMLVKWTFVGVGPDLGRLQKIAKKLGIDKQIEFLVALPPDDLKRLYHQSHVFVLPSVVNPGGHVETQGVVLQEAQASGCIVVGSDVGGIPECINDGVDAFVVKPKSSRELAQKITSIYQNPEQWDVIRSAGRKNVESRYAADVIGREMARLLKSLIKV